MLASLGLSSRPYVHLSARDRWALTRQDAMLIDIWALFDKTLTKCYIKVWQQQQMVFYFRTTRLFDQMSHNSRICTGNKNTHFVFSKFFFENPAIYGIMWEKLLFSHGRQCNTCTLQATYPRLETHTSCFSSAKIITTNRLNETLYTHCLSCSH